VPADCVAAATPTPRNSTVAHAAAGPGSGPLPPCSFVVAIPVYNEEAHVAGVLPRVRKHAGHVLVIDDGSSDRTPQILEEFARAEPDRVRVVRHETNQGYGTSMRAAFAWAAARGVSWLITMDCDEQHEPEAIPEFVAAACTQRWDVISGSRYLRADGADDRPPEDRRRINHLMTEEINRRLGLGLTDAFCGFKAYRVSALGRMTLTEPGYAFPMQFWVQAAALALRITEIPVRLIYNDLNRSFGGPLDDPQVRLAHYTRVLHCEMERWAAHLPAKATRGVSAGCGE